jgi:hypothetical protein
MKYKTPVLTLLTMCLFSSIASAQVAGGVLCGLGFYCPPPGPPAGKKFELIIKGSPIGSTVADYYGSAGSSFNNTARYFLKMQVGNKITWDTSARGRFVGGELNVLKIGSRIDNFDNCFKYHSAIRITDFDFNTKIKTLIAKEDYDGAACAVSGLDPNPRVIPDFLYYEVDSREVNWK